VALEVGIVGLPNAGKTMLFNALTGAGATVSAKENVGMAPVADERLDRIAQVVPAKKVTPASVRIVDVPGSGAQLFGNLRQVDALLLVLDGWSGTRNPEDDRETLGLELLLADREHVERRLERVTKQAKSGDPALRDEVAVLQRLAAHLDAGETLATFSEPIPAELEPLTTKPLLAVVNGAEGIDLQLEAELAELSAEEASAFREGASALDEIVRRLFAALDLVSFFTAGDKETRAWTLRRGLTALDAAASIHTDIANGFIRAEVIRWNDLVECGSHAEAARRGLQRLEGKAYQVEDGDVLNIRFSPPRDGR
jgi:ribosome-binding ATPase YchF (GTP1/OBG family)